MSYFSRLTDIVTCNLSALLADATDPQAALVEIIHEMEEGVAGARRSVKTATTNEERIRSEIDEHMQQTAHWADTAREELSASREDKARLAIMRKREVEDLVAGLEQQHAAAAATREHLTTTLHALEARLADAHRRQSEMAAGASQIDEPRSKTGGLAPPPLSAEKDRQIDEELAALKRELGQ